jgi:hypothetical protein
VPVDATTWQEILDAGHQAGRDCGFWDADKDGVITEAEYVKQGSSFGKKK